MTIHIVPTPAQYDLLTAGDGYEVNLWAVRMFMERAGMADVDAAFEAICEAQELQRRFNRTSPVRVNIAYIRKEQEYRMLVRK